jgi:hypothetical protein
MNVLKRLLKILAFVILAAVLLFTAYTYVVLHWSYSTGERAGYVQKISKKGWICKTWEGELAMVNIPGSLTEKFEFTVPEDAVAEKINQTMGEKVSLTYEQHVGLPPGCFGETGYYVVAVKTLPLKDKDAKE